MAKGRWTLALSGAAERDFADIVAWTAENFGARQADNYARLIENALEKLGEEPYAPPSRDRGGDIGAGLRSLHLRRPGRHLILYKVEDQAVMVLRILHDSMDVTRHVPPGA